MSEQLSLPPDTHPALVSLKRAAVDAYAAGGDWERFWKDWEATIRRWTKTPRRYRVMRTCLYRLVTGMDRPILPCILRPVVVTVHPVREIQNGELQDIDIGPK